MDATPNFLATNAMHLDLPVAARPVIRACPTTVPGYPRDRLGNRFVYVVVSPRARGLAVEINFNPDKFCNFDCIYCEVSRSIPSLETRLDIDVMASELVGTIQMISAGGLRERPGYANLPDDLLQFRHVALSGEGEPTFCPQFLDAVQSIVHLRAMGRVPFFKMVLVTNATGLNEAPVREGLKYFTAKDEIWAKLDVGTQEHMNRINRSQMPLEKILTNILEVSKSRPIVIQSLFPAVAGDELRDDEIDQYVQRLAELKQNGAQISLVQIYSAARPAARQDCSHQPLKRLSTIAQRVRIATGLPAEVF